MSAACRQRGFTLVEIVVALTLTALIVGFATMMMTTPMNAYLNQSNDAVLVDSSEVVTRRMAEDLRRALPNSVSVRNVGSRSIVEMLIVESVGFYQTSGLGDANRHLDFGIADTRFSLFGRINPAALNPYPVNGTWHLVVGNMGRGNPGRDAYQPGPSPGVITPNGTDINVAPLVSPEDALTLSPGFRFQIPVGAISQRIFLVSGPVTYICNSAANARALRRYSKYQISPNIPASEAAAQLNVPGVEVETLSTDIAACRFRCQGAGASPAVCGNTLVVQIDTSRAISTGGASRVRLHQQFPVDNLP